MTIPSGYKILAVLPIIIIMGMVSCSNREENSELPAPVMSPATSEKPDNTEKEYIHQILVTGEPGINEYSKQPPGQSTILPREFPGAPPFVPHSLSGLTINKEQNPCLACHATGLSLGPDHAATKIPESHYTDITTGGKSKDIQPIRYNCLICHNPQSSEIPPLER